MKGKNGPGAWTTSDWMDRLPLLKVNDKAGLAALLPANWAAKFKNRQVAAQIPPATKAA